MHTLLFHKKEHGFTLIEMLVVIAIICIIMPVLAATITSLYKTNNTTLARALALYEANEAARQVVRDVRAATYAEDGSLPVVAIASSSLTLFADTDFDGDVERVRYTLTGTNLLKGVIEPTTSATYPVGSEVVETLAHNIMNNSTTTSVFRYYSATSTEITLSSKILDVRRIEVRLVGASSQSTLPNRVISDSSASIRNLKDSY
jgi:prepilin-type N-terminal cleavage/methylation domain-containing protein